MDLRTTLVRTDGVRVRILECGHGCTYRIIGGQAPPLRWTVFYPDDDYGMTDTMREARAWAEIDHGHRH